MSGGVALFLHFVVSLLHQFRFLGLFAKIDRQRRPVVQNLSDLVLQKLAGLIFFEIVFLGHPRCTELRL